MTSKRPIGVSILTAAGLIGTTRLFTPRGTTRAARAAIRNGFGLQLLPLGQLPGLTQSFEAFAESLHPDSVVSFEGRWGGDDPLHPWRHYTDGVTSILAYYALFPVLHRHAQRKCYQLHHLFPNALPIDTSLPNSSQEISPRTNADTQHWIEQAMNGQSLVLDTYHLLGPWKNGTSEEILKGMQRHSVQLPLVHVQFRNRTTLEAFLQSTTSSTEAILRQTNRLLCPNAPVIIELPPWLVTIDRLDHVRQRIHAILD